MPSDPKSCLQIIPAAVVLAEKSICSLCVDYLTYYHLKSKLCKQEMDELLRARRGKWPSEAFILIYKFTSLLIIDPKAYTTNITRKKL